MFVESARAGDEPARLAAELAAKERRVEKAADVLFQVGVSDALKGRRLALAGIQEPFVLRPVEIGYQAS